MNLEQLIDAARSRADDATGKLLWSDEEWTAYANDAENEACRRARLIVDSTTPEIIELALSADTATVDLDQRILFIRRARLVGRSPLLARISHKDLDAAGSEWEDETGEPRGYVPDLDDGKFRPYPTPDVAGTVKLTVVRLPLEPMANDNDEPEIKPHLHQSLVAWMLYRAYSKQDAETVDPVKASAYADEFAQEFGKKSSAIDEVWIAREHGFLEDEGIF